MSKSTVLTRNLSRTEMRKRFGLAFLEPSLTKQAHKAECDINSIVERYHKAGVSMPVAEAVQDFFDASSVPDFQGAMNIVAESTELFLSLPARVRSAFDNDTSTFLNYMEKPNDALINRLLVDYNLLTPQSDSKAPPEPKSSSGKGTTPTAPKATPASNKASSKGSSNSDDE